MMPTYFGSRNHFIDNVFILRPIKFIFSGSEKLILLRASSGGTFCCWRNSAIRLNCGRALGWLFQQSLISCLKDSGHCRCATLSCLPFPIIHMMECVGKFKGHLPVRISNRIVLYAYTFDHSEFFSSGDKTQPFLESVRMSSGARYVRCPCGILA